MIKCKLLYGRHKGAQGESFKPGDVVELTERQLAAFGAKFEVVGESKAEAKAEAPKPKKRGRKSKAEKEAEAKAEAEAAENEDSGDAETTDEAE